MTYYLYDYILHLQTPNGRFHVDPILEEFTYGDTEREADWILSNIKPDDIVFFHVTIRGDRYITAMFFIESVVNGDTARTNPDTVNRYRNPHLSPNFIGYHEDVIIFGDHERSKIFHPPIIFDRELAQKLSLNISFDTIDRTGRHRTDLECISSATRTARELSENDVRIILQEGIRKWP